LIAGAHNDQNSAIGLILGTGCNICYLEKVANMEKWTGCDKAEEVIT
jgi:hexokinase